MDSNSPNPSFSDLNHPLFEPISLSLFLFLTSVKLAQQNSLTKNQGNRGTHGKKSQRSLTCSQAISCSLSTLKQHKNLPNSHIQNQKTTNIDWITRMASRVSICFMVFDVCLFVSSLTRIGVEDSESKEFVLTLNHSNFSETVSKHDFVILISLSIYIYTISCLLFSRSVQEGHTTTWAT
jgi:hypothetical protein